MKACTLVFLLLACSVSLAQSHPIDPSLSKVTIHVDKTGLFSFAGDQHEITGPISSGAIDEKAGTVEFTIESAKLQVLDPKLEDKKRAEVQKTMLGPSVLDTAQYPEIKFHSTKTTSTAPNAWEVTGDLTLHGQTHPVTTAVKKENGIYSGTAKLKQTEFGITPVSVAGGTVKVKDELKLDFQVVTH